MELVNEETRGRPKRLPRQVRERQILDAAVRVFSAHGYHAASMDEISATAGISKPMIYSYLGAKEDLFATCIRRELDRLLKAIAERAEPGLRAERQLWRGLLAFFEFIGQNQDSWRVLHRQASEHGGPFAAEHRELRARAIELIAALVIGAASHSEHAEVGQTAQRTGESLAAAVVGAAESLADWWLEHPHESARHLAERMMNVVWAGFGDMMTGQVWTPPADDPDGGSPTRGAITAADAAQHGTDHGGAESAGVASDVAAQVPRPTTSADADAAATEGSASSGTASTGSA